MVEYIFKVQVNGPSFKAFSYPLNDLEKGIVTTKQNF